MRGLRTTLFVLAAGFMLAVSIPATAKGARKPSGGGGCTSGSPVPVTSIIYNMDGNSQPFQFQSDGLGSYTSYNNSRTDSAISEIQQNSCDWLLDLSQSSSRTVALTFSGANPPFTGTQNVSARIISKCAKNPDNHGISYGSMTSSGQTLECGFSADFILNGNEYAVRWEPDNFAGTTWVQVQCTGAASGACNQWTVMPDPNVVINNGTGQTSSIGELIQITTVKGKTVSTSLGQFYVAFSVLISQ
jgi:hypothetical protein